MLIKGAQESPVHLNIKSLNPVIFSTHQQDGNPTQTLWTNHDGLKLDQFLTVIFSNIRSIKWSCNQFDMFGQNILDFSCFFHQPITLVDPFLEFYCIGHPQKFSLKSWLHIQPPESEGKEQSRRNCFDWLKIGLECFHIFYRNKY